MNLFQKYMSALMIPVIAANLATASPIYGDQSQKPAEKNKGAYSIPVADLDFSKLDFGRELEITVGGKPVKYCVEGPTIVSLDKKYAVLQLDHMIYEDRPHLKLSACLVDNHGSVLDLRQFDSNLYNIDSAKANWSYSNGKIVGTTLTLPRTEPSDDHSEHMNKLLRNAPLKKSILLLNGQTRGHARDLGTYRGR